MSDHISKVTTEWTLDPPYETTTRHMGRRVQIVKVVREFWADGRTHWSAKGIPLTKTGKPNGGVDWRFISEEDIDALRTRVLG